MKSEQESNKVESRPKTDKVLVELLNIFFVKHKQEGSSKAIDFVLDLNPVLPSQINELKNQLSTLSLAAGGFTDIHARW